MVNLPLCSIIILNLLLVTGHEDSKQNILKKNIRVKRAETKELINDDDEKMTSVDVDINKDSTGRRWSGLVHLVNALQDNVSGESSYEINEFTTVNKNIRRNGTKIDKVKEKKNHKVKGKDKRKIVDLPNLGHNINKYLQKQIDKNIRRKKWRVTYSNVYGDATYGKPVHYGPSYTYRDKLTNKTYSQHGDGIVYGPVYHLGDI